MLSLLRHVRAVGLFLAVAMAIPGGVPAATAPANGRLRAFRLADGLVHDSVRALLQDSRGYLWVGTAEGISRFDGYEFTSFGVGDGLTVPYVNALAEDIHGRVWAATNGAGLARFAGEAFLTIAIAPDAAANRVNEIVVDGATLLLATDGGLYRADLTGPGGPVFSRIGASDVVQELVVDGPRAWALLEHRGLVLIEGDQLTTIVPPPGDLTRMVLLEHAGDHLLVGTLAAMYRFDITARDASGWTRIALPLAPKEVPRAALPLDDGRLWIGTSTGLLRLDGARVTRETPDSELDIVDVLYLDRANNLWLGTRSRGLWLLTEQEVPAYGRAHGLPDDDVLAVRTAAGNGVHVVTGEYGWFRWREGRFVGVPGTGGPPLDGIGKRLVCGPHECWALTESGLFRFDVAVQPPAGTLVHAFPSAVRPVSFSGRGPTGLVQDSSGHLWFATSEPALYRLLPSRPARVERMPVVLDTHMAPMVAHPSGTLWLARMDALARVRDGQVERLLADDATVQPRSGHVDARGWLWVGLRFHGVMMTRTPDAVRPEWTRYTQRHGLSSDAVWSITSDAAGRVYFATDRGIDRLDPRTGAVDTFTVADGLASNVVHDCVTDADGRVWVATAEGLSVIAPEVRSRRGEIAMQMTALSAAGEPLPLPDGEARLVPRVPAGARRLTFEFAGVRPSSASNLKYQHRLLGLDDRWSPYTPQRAVTFAHLAPGAYRFEVRALDAGADAPTRTASIDVVVLAPWWQQTWVLASALAGVMAVTVIVHRQRLRRRRAVEALREQVASDLHDDIGSGLAQIAIQSEVLQRRHPESGDGLSDIAQTARALREAMSDIVWAVRSGPDRLREAVERMRQAAFTLLDYEGLHVQFDAPPDEVLDRVKLAPDRRRHLLLVFKEAVTNVARHAQATRLHVQLAIESRHLRLTVHDNGRGFSPPSRSQGRGLENIRARTVAMQGELRVDSGASGTTMTVIVPLS